MLSVKPVPVKFTSTLSFVRSVLLEGEIFDREGETWAGVPAVLQHNRNARALALAKFLQ